MKLTDLERKRLKKLQDAANEYQEARVAVNIEGHRVANMGTKVYADFEKFWAPIRARESK